MGTESLTRGAACARGGSPAELHGLSSSELGLRLYRLWNLQTRGGRSSAGQRDLANALVYLRQTGRPQYDLPDHTWRAQGQEGAVPQEEARAVARAGFRVGTWVRVLGEAGVGVVIHRVIARDCGPCAAAWYVIAAPQHGVCRAHGMDEIELR